MKNLFKRSVAVFLTVVMLLAAAPLSGFVGLELPDFFSFKSKALSTDEYLDYSVFEMEYLMNQLEHDGTILNGSVDIYDKVKEDNMFHRDVYEVYSADGNLQGATFAAVQLWDNDINLIAHPEHFYSVILMDLLQNNELLDYSVDSLKSNVVSNTNKIVKEAYKSSADSLIESMGIESLNEYMNTSFKDLSESERIILGDQLVDCNRFSMDYADVMDALALLDVVADVGTTISNAISRANSLYAIAGYNKNNIALLLDMYYRSGNSDLKIAILDIVGIYSELDSAEEIYTALNGNIASYAVDSLLFTTTKLVASTLFKSALGLATFVWDIGSAVTNMLFDVSDVATCYMVIEASTLIEDELRSLMSSYRSSYLSSKTSANAEKCKTVYNLTLANQYYALSAVKKLAYSSFGNGSLWGMVKSAFGCQDYQTVADVCDSQMSIVEGRYYKWVSLAQKMYKNVYGVSFSHAATAPTISVSSVSFERSSYTLFINEGILNRATAYPTNAVDREVYYSSSDPSVAVVGAYGNITAVSYGEAVITATSLNGKSASCKITVLPYYATVENGSYTIDKFTGGAMNVTVPSAVNGISVTRIGDGAFRDTAVTGVVIPNSITTIGDYAFYSCDNLTNITIPNSVTTIGNYAFGVCDNLTSISIPDSVTTVGEGAFYYCDNLASVTIGNGVKNIGDMAFYSCGSLTSIVIPDNVITIGKDILGCCYGLTSVVIGNGVTSDIEHEMFRDFDNLETVVIGNSVAYIDGAAFYDCDSLKSVTIGDGVTLIGGEAFYDCGKLESIIIGNGVKTIEYSAFYQCTSLKELTMPVSATIGNGYFLHGIYYDEYEDFYDPDIEFFPVFEGCENIEKITLTKGTGTMPDYNRYITSFDEIENCLRFMPWNISTSLKELVIADGVKNISEYAFEIRNDGGSNQYYFEGYYCQYAYFITRGYNGCRSLVNITIPDSVTSIYGNAFHGTAYYNTSSNWKNELLYIDNALIAAKTSLSGSVVIDSATTAIAGSAFSNCDNLTSVTLPDSITTIGSSTFYDCDNLTSVTIPDSVTTIGSSAFYGCDNLTSVTLPDSITTIGNFAFSDCDNLTSFNVDSNNKYYSSDNYGVLFNKNQTNIIQYPAGNTRTSYTIPDSVTNIGDGTFKNCDSLTSVTIGDSVTSIGDSAFDNCDSLVSVTIPDSVTSIGDSAFEYCESLASVTIGDSVTSIGDSAFGRCDSLASVTIGNSVTTIGWRAFEYCYSLTSVTIPDSVTTISTAAFWNCDSLTSVTIGNSVTTIGNYAFSGCDSLTSVTIPNSVTTIGNYAFEYCESLTSVTIPDSVTTIGWGAFDYCTSLTSVTIGDSVTTIGWGAFDYCDSLTSFNVDSNNKYYSSDSYGVLFNKNKTSLIQYPIGNTRTSYTIPDSVTTIGADAFWNCGNLTSVTIGNSVTTIDYGAFEDCYSLTSVTIPDSVTTIAWGAFEYCDSLTDVYYRGDNKQWKNIYIDSYNSRLTNATIHYNHKCAYSYQITSEPTSDQEGCKRGTCVCGDAHNLSVPATGFEIEESLAIDFNDNLIYGFSVGDTVLDGYVDFVNEGYEWRYDTLNGVLGTGSKAIVTDGEKTVAEYTVVIFGDVDGNGWYDANDAFLVRMLDVGLLTREAVGEAVYKAADCNHDGVVDGLDVQLLERASILLDNVNQSATQAELSLDSAYIEYCSVIDQSAGFETESAPEENNAEIQPAAEPDLDLEVIFSFILSVIERIFSYVFSIIS